jgi:energy-converting hydrogenase Eha subunit C
MIASGSFLLILQLAGELSWRHPLTKVISASLLLSSLVFVLNERYWTDDPLISPLLMRTNRLGVICVAQIFIMFAQFGVRLRS